MNNLILMLKEVAGNIHWSWNKDAVELFNEINPDFWASISPITYVADLSGPLQLHHSAEDESVPIAFSESLYQAAQTAGGVVEFYTYPGNDHNLSQSFTLAMRRSIEFFDRYLKVSEKGS